MNKQLFIKMLKSKGYSYCRIANLLGISRQSLCSNHNEKDVEQALIIFSACVLHYGNLPDDGFIFDFADTFLKISNNLKVIRTSCNLTQLEFANDIGVNIQKYIKYEKNDLVLSKRKFWSMIYVLCSYNQKNSDFILKEKFPILSYFYKAYDNLAKAIYEIL